MLYLQNTPDYIFLALKRKKKPTGILKYLQYLLECDSEAVSFKNLFLVSQEFAYPS